MRLRFIGMILFTLWIVSFSSCSHQYYVPKPVEPVLLTAGKQLKLSGAVNMSNSYPLASISLAGSPVHNLGVLASVATGDKTASVWKNSFDSITHRERIVSTNFGLGYYRFISKDLLFECYGGAGAYTYKNDASAFIGQLKFRNYFVQPSVAFVRSNVEMGFTLRYDLLHRYKTTIDRAIVPAGPEQFSFLNYKNYSFLQPGFSIRFGMKQVMLEFLWSQSFALSRKYETIYGNDKWRSGKSLLGMGLLLNIDRFFN
jgi:hypothetical protein